MDKDAVDLEIRLQAIEYVLCEVGKIALLSAGLTPEHAAQFRKNGREVLLKEMFPGIDPAMADHVSAELADRVEDLLARVEKLVADAFGKANRNPTPPSAA